MSFVQIEIILTQANNLVLLLKSSKYYGLIHSEIKALISFCHCSPLNPLVLLDLTGSRYFSQI